MIGVALAGGELGALLAEAQWIATLRPSHNRAPRTSRSDPADAPWPFTGAIVFDERLVELPDHGLSAATLEMVGRRPQLCAFEAQPRIGVVGTTAECVRVLDDGAVVVLPVFGVFSTSERR